MSKYIDRDKLAEFARHSTIGIDANDIMRFPTADVVEVKHGEWVKKAEAFTNLYGETEYVVHGICSVCNQRQSFGDYPFCPWCGADMRERKETE